VTYSGGVALVVEDDESIRDVIIDVLEDHGSTVVSVRSVVARPFGVDDLAAHVERAVSAPAA
jgi:CheY-like chemotaxis protein